MAFAAARAAMQARARRKALIKKAQSMTKHELDESERKGLLGSLKQHEATEYIVTLVESPGALDLYCIVFLLFHVFSHVHACPRSSLQYSLRWSI